MYCATRVHYIPKRNKSSTIKIQNHKKTIEDIAISLLLDLKDYGSIKVSQKGKGCFSLQEYQVGMCCLYTVQQLNPFCIYKSKNGVFIQDSFATSSKLGFSPLLSLLCFDSWASFFGH